MIANKYFQQFFLMLCGGFTASVKKTKQKKTTHTHTIEKIPITKAFDFFLSIFSCIPFLNPSYDILPAQRTRGRYAPVRCEFERPFWSRRLYSWYIIQESSCCSQKAEPLSVSFIFTTVPVLWFQTSPLWSQRNHWPIT